MKTNKIILAAFVLATAVSCVKHENVPTPVKLVKLTTSFTGTINGTDVEFTDDVEGFNGFDSQDQTLLAAPELSSVKYYCDMNSDITGRSLKVGIGSLQWDYAALTKPSLNQFNTFFGALPSSSVYYSDGASNGFIVYYRDGGGTTWTSREITVNTQSVKFNTVKLDSDDTGDYALCNIGFSCYVYHINTSVNPPETDSLRIDNGDFTCWFKR